MQKLASSSVAAIRRALKGRLERLKSGKERVDELKKLLSDYEQYNFDEDEEINQIEESILELSSSLKLKEDEEDALQELIQAADGVSKETKINKILSIVNEEFSNRNILFFTEYKATQSLLMSALIKQFGNKFVSFINGDDKATDVVCKEGKVKILYETRESASEKFNSGQIRFLVSTEAAGEGIDLQENCYSLIHVDLPWNPMRLHQRAGRLNRFGQTQRVEIVLLRNPDTVESLIWDKLNNKIEQISLALGAVMEEPEDLRHLVLGMASPSIFREIFSEATHIPKEALSAWFDQKTARFGGQDVVETVKSLVGHCSKFDFQAVSSLIPQVDLPDLKQFLTAMLMFNHRQVNEENESISFITPDVWRGDIGILPQYQNLIFNRTDRSKDVHKRLLGVGHKIFDLALAQAKSFSVSLTTVPEDLQEKPLYIFRIRDRVTTDKTSLRAIVVGIQVSKDGISVELLQDWELLKFLNNFISRKLFLREISYRPNDFEIVHQIYDKAETFLRTNFNNLDLSFKHPDVELISIIWPTTTTKPLALKGETENY